MSRALNQFILVVGLCYKSMSGHHNGLWSI